MEEWIVYWISNWCSKEMLRPIQCTKCAQWLGVCHITLDVLACKDELWRMPCRTLLAPRWRLHIWRSSTLQDSSCAEMKVAYLEEQYFVVRSTTGLGTPCQSLRRNILWHFPEPLWLLNLCCCAAWHDVSNRDSPRLHSIAVAIRRPFDFTAPSPRTLAPTAQQKWTQQLTDLAVRKWTRWPTKHCLSPATLHSFAPTLPQRPHFLKASVCHHHWGYNCYSYYIASKTKTITGVSIAL